MKKRVLSLILALCLVVGLCPGAFAATLDNGLEYEIVDDHVKITGYIDNGTPTEFVIPSEIEGLPVTAIGAFAFDSMDRYKIVTGVTIPDSVTSIGRGAFSHCYALTSIIIPEGVTSICPSTFWECENLESVTIPSAVTSIGDHAFYGCCSLKSIVIPDGVTILDEEVFYGCSNMTSIAIPASVTAIGWAAFNFCKNLTDIYYGGSEEQWNAITIDSRNDALQNATIHYNSKMPGEITNPFTDVSADSFYYDSVLWAIGSGITTGATDTTFNPNGQCLRAQVVTFLHRAAENPEPTAVNNPFTDVKSTDFFYKPVLWAVEEGITNGVSANKFGSYDVCNRAQVVTFLYRAFGSPAVSTEGLPFTDVPAGAWYEAPIAWAVENGITNGLTATEFGPTASCNRAQVVTFLYRAYN